jgi:quinol monooxygenase YgiN
MLIRIVRLTFSPDTVETFLDQFDDSAPQIRQFPGCQHLELWRDADTPHVCTTYSHWDDADALDRYRQSALFETTWAKVTPLFNGRPEAHSYTVARPAHTIE